MKDLIAGTIHVTKATDDVYMTTFAPRGDGAFERPILHSYGDDDFASDFRKLGIGDADIASTIKTLKRQEDMTRPIANYPRAGLTVLGLL